MKYGPCKQNKSTNNCSHNELSLVDRGGKKILLTTGILVDDRIAHSPQWSHSWQCSQSITRTINDSEAARVMDFFFNFIMLNFPHHNSTFTKMTKIEIKQIKILETQSFNKSRRQRRRRRVIPAAKTASTICVLVSTSWWLTWSRRKIRKSAAFWKCWCRRSGFDQTRTRKRKRL